PSNELLRAVGGAAADSDRQDGPRYAGGDRERRAGCRIGEGDAATDGGDGPGDGCTTRFHEARGPCSRHVQVRATCPRPQYPSEWSHTPAAIRAWQARNGRRGSWRVRVPRYQRGIPGREASASVLGALHGRRIVGRTRLTA